MTDFITMAHGNGGATMQELIRDYFVEAFDNPILSQGEDQARIALQELNALGGTLSFSTDSFVIDPIFFPGGDIGKLAVCGTANDVAVCGAVPKYLSCGFILEEGFPLSDLKRIVESMAAAAKEAGVKIVTGDTKVVERGKADGIYINTCGVGVLPEGVRLSGANCRPGDVIAISGDIGDHGVAVMSQRVNLGFETGVVSDSASLNRLTEKLVAEIPSLRCMRDPTRGGLGTTLNEIAKQSSVGMVLEEDKIPVKESVEAACEFLGLDPLYVANEGKVIAICAPEDASNHERRSSWQECSDHRPLHRR